ncbi:AMP-binding protein [Streptomyces sp. NPDC088789]|uniref:AMP-binding protein n=1 Tax=Streptomyces sp. NPDC088789 TaxID=3365899 RepID=UPI00382DC243
MTELFRLYAQDPALPPATPCSTGPRRPNAWNAPSLAFAAALRGAGVPPGSTVGILPARSGDALVPAMLGVLRAGCAYVGLDRAAPAHRTTEVVTGARCAAVINEDTTHDLGRTLTCPTVRAATVPSRPDTPPLPGTEPSVCPDDPAYLMFTSGSTGRPKGMAIAHHPAVNLIRSAGDLQRRVSARDTAGLPRWPTHPPPHVTRATRTY